MVDASPPPVKEPKHSKCDRAKKAIETAVMVGICIGGMAGLSIGFVLGFVVGWALT